MREVHREECWRELNRRGKSWQCESVGNAECWKCGLELNRRVCNRFLRVLKDFQKQQIRNKNAGKHIRTGWRMILGPVRFSKNVQEMKKLWNQNTVARYIQNGTVKREICKN